MIGTRLQGCLLLLLFLLTKASASSLPDTIVGAVAPALPASSEPEGAAVSSDSKRRSLATGSTGLFCVAIQGANPTALQAGLDWACAQGRADCSEIQPGGPCYKANNVQALASYAYNDYYHRNAAKGATCDFNGTATTTTTDPSSGQCIFSGSSTPAASAPSGLSPTFTPPTSFGLSSNLVPFNGAESLLSGARRALAVLLLLALPLFFLVF